MKDDSFRDLLNLYLDGELSAAEEARLAEYLASDAELRAEFMEACRLHGATQMALNPQALQPNDLNQRYFWSRLFMGFAAASCAVLGAMFLMPCVINDEAAHISVPLCSKDPVLSQTEIERATKEKAAHEAHGHPTACLAAHFRLQGLEPTVAPADRALLPLEIEAYLHKRSVRLSEVNFEEQAARLILTDFLVEGSGFHASRANFPGFDPIVNHVQKIGVSGSLVGY